MGLREHRRILLAHPGEVVDVKEAAMTPGGGVDVEEAPAQSRVGPEAVGIIGGHVVGDEVEHDSQAGGMGRVGQLPERGLAPEVGGDAGRVDDVVAVGGAGSSLQGRREIQMGDTEVAHIRDLGLRGGEAEVRGELEAIRRPQRRRPPQATRFRIVIECATTLTSAAAP